MRIFVRAAVSAALILSAFGCGGRGDRIARAHSFDEAKNLAAASGAPFLLEFSTAN